jgi:hypothetical protein
MNTPATTDSSGTDMQTAILEQIDALNDAASAIQALPVFDDNAFNAVNGFEQNLESLYTAYQYDASVPDLSTTSLSSLQALLAQLQNAIQDSQATSQSILAAAQLVGAFQPAAAA